MDEGKSVLTDLLTLPEVSRLLPGKPHPSTLWRWRKKGVSGVKLRTVRVGGRTYVQRRALEQFVEAMTRAAESDEAVAERTPETAARLESAGLA